MPIGWRKDMSQENRGSKAKWTKFFKPREASCTKGKKDGGRKRIIKGEEKCQKRILRFA